MRFSILYEKVLNLWPEEIPINDGKPLGPECDAVSSNSVGRDGLWSFPSLCAAWDAAEDQINASVDTWEDLMIWSMYQVFQREAIRLSRAGAVTLRPSVVQISSLDLQLRHNLEAEGWESERHQYEGM